MCKLAEIEENPQKPFLPTLLPRENFLLAPNILTQLSHMKTEGLAWQVTSSSYSVLVKDWSCGDMESACGVSSLSSLIAVASSVSWDTTEASDLRTVSAELFSCMAGILPWTVARLWKWPLSAKDSNLSESLDDAYSSSGCSVLCPSSFLGEPSTITRKDFHGVFLSCIEVCRRRVDLSVNVRPHALHMNGFSPVWIRWWRWSALSWVNCLPHWSQQ